MLPRLMRRLLSTKVSRPLPHAKKVENAASAQEVAGVEPDKSIRESAAAKNNPWSHFAAFSSMDDYVDVTLIQYNKDDDDKND
ncbi:uncharacterized protein KRP23_13964 [Phytophthora ramorum]|uniref:uncharacterized protein n=1 Tax=Phytophthora ramorum TaxID=164328 RepID=UPI0030AB9105|nr:hypothetical protein KRP23_13964 [Phytophthora ramorum]